MFHLVTFGGLRLEDSGNSAPPQLRRSWLAMLAVIAASGERGVTRDRLITIFWPESDEERARQSARQALYGLRQELGREVVLTRGNLLSLDPRGMSSDVADFKAAVASGDREHALTIHAAPFLEGFVLSGSPQFQRWAEEEGDRIARLRVTALNELAAEAMRAGRLDAAVEWWRRLTEADPLNGRVAVGYLKALAARGDRAAALAFARKHESMIRRELEVEPDPEVRRFEASLRATPAAIPAPQVASVAPDDSVAGPAGDPVPPPGSVPSATTKATAPAIRRTWPWTLRAAVGVAAAALLALGRERIARADAPLWPGKGAAAGHLAVSTTSATARRLYEEGVRAYQLDDRSSARRLMRAALVDDSTFAMAAYYEALLAGSNNDRTPDGRHAGAARQVALRLARRASDRERLLISANVLGDDMDPRAVAVAESLATRFPDDPESQLALGRALCTAGDWAGSVRAITRAIELDARTVAPAGTCRVCEHLNLLGWVYLWADSLDAAARTAHRLQAIQPNGSSALYSLAVISSRRGDTTGAYQWYRQLMQRNPTDRAWKLILDLRLEQYEMFELGLEQLRWSKTATDGLNARWYQLISLRNQGRMREAREFHKTGHLTNTAGPPLPGEPDLWNEAILALERGDGRTTARIFENMPPPDTAVFSVGHIMRHRAWYGTLAGMGYAAVGDTVHLKVLADSVKQWGSRSLFGRDRVAHHYLRGMLELARGQDEASAREFRDAIVSPNLGFTRVNYELGRVLTRLGRPREAVAVLQPALRGELDASNLYITQTELHEQLATAFDLTGQRDSAAVHYAAVVRAWQRADPHLRVRRDRAAQRLAVLERR